MFQVLRESGMGLAHSGNLADLALANLADGWALRGEMRKKFDIKGFWRFKDDVLAAMNCPFPQVQAWYGFYKRRAESIFELWSSGLGPAELRPRREGNRQVLSWVCLLGALLLARLRNIARTRSTFRNVSADCTAY